jgi:hypothetical protein
MHSPPEAGSRELRGRLRRSEGLTVVEAANDSHQGVTLRRMAGEMYLALFGVAPDVATVEAAASTATEPGEATVALHSSRGGSGLLFVRTPGAGPDDRWLTATESLEAFQAQMRADVASTVRCLPLARGVLPESYVLAGRAWGASGRLRLVVSEAFLRSAFVPLPLDGERALFRVPQPLHCSPFSGVVVSSVAVGSLTAGTDDVWNARLDEFGRLTLGGPGRLAQGSDEGFEFALTLSRATAGDGGFTVQFAGGGTGYGRWRGYRAVWMAGAGVVALATELSMEDDDRTQELEQTLPPARAR